MSKTMGIVVPIMGGLVESKPFWGTLLHSVKGPVDLYVVDNTGFDEHQESFFGTFVAPYWPGHVHMDVKNSNVGVFQSMQDAYKDTHYDILAYIHNDLYIYHYGWDQDVISVFEDVPTLGLLGFFGAEGVARNAGRFNSFSNMLEAEKHGARYNPPGHLVTLQVAVLDGMAMIASRKMLDERGGVDTGYDIHHFYDLDLSLESIDRGFMNAIIPVPIHHQSGMTACKPVFQDWADKYVEGGERTLYEKSKERFIEKWEAYLPWQVGQEWKKRPES